MRSLILVPTYNEKDNIEPIIRAIFASVPTVSVLVIDDGSPDGTGQIADRLAQEFPQLNVLHRKEKNGLGPAYIAGMKWGLDQGYDALIEMDADFSHHPRYLPTMLKGLEKTDCMFGSRYVSGGGTVNWGLGRKILSRGGSFYAQMILGAPVSDYTGGFNGWRSQVLKGIDLDKVRSDGYCFQIELKYKAWKKGFTQQEFPIVFEDRKVGHSKMSRAIVLEAITGVWKMKE